MRPLLVVCCVLMACGTENNLPGGTDEGPLGSGTKGGEGAVSQCAERSGSYLYRATKRTGTCPEMAESIIDMDAQSSPPADCEVTQSGNACSYTTRMTCSEMAATAVVNWSANGFNGSGILDITITPAGSSSCTGTYDLTYTKL